jgi:hypothetical protein
MIYEWKIMLIIPLRNSVTERQAQVGGTPAFYSGATSSNLGPQKG